MLQLFCHDLAASFPCNLPVCACVRVHGQVRLSSKQTPHFLSQSRPLSHARCLELANHCLGFNGWTSDIITVRNTPHLVTSRWVIVTAGDFLSVCLLSSAEEAPQWRRRRRRMWGWGGWRREEDESEIRVSAAALLPPSRADDQRSSGGRGQLHLHRWGRLSWTMKLVLWMSVFMLKEEEQVTGL